MNQTHTRNKCKVKISDDAGSHFSAAANRKLFGDESVPITQRIEQGEKIKGRNTSPTEIHAWIVIMILLLLLGIIILAKKQKRWAGVGFLLAGAFIF